MTTRQLKALKQAQALLRGLTFKDTKVTNALESIHRALEDAQECQLTDTTFDHLAGRGLHELRFDELPAYLSAVATNYGPQSDLFKISAQWVAGELERKTNDERALAAQLSALREGSSPQGECPSGPSAEHAEPGPAGSRPGEAA